MSALVCGKRAQLEDISSSPGSSPPTSAQKRARHRTGGSPSRFLEGGWAATAASTISLEKLSVLRGLFPSMNAEELQRALEECGHDLDLTIKGLNLLCLAPADRGRETEAHVGSRSHGSPEQRTAAASSVVASASAAVASQGEQIGGPTGDGGVAQGPVPTEQTAHAAAVQAPCGTDGSGGSILTSVLSVEWVDAVVQEMMSARDLDDARQRAARVLQTFGAAVLERATGGKDADLQRLQQQVAALQRDNQILKRAVAIQHERHLAHQAREAEVANLKQMLGQYQEQLRKLEVNNYALSLHLQKAQVGDVIPNRFHPDVF